MLALIEQLLEQCVPTKRQQRDYLLKFPDEIVNESMATHLLFAAELLVGGTYVEVEEANGILLRPLAKNLLHSLADLRYILREQSLEDPGIYPETMHQALLQYDSLYSEFELRYVSLIVSIKTPEEIYARQEVAVLFCETVSRALKQGYLSQELIDDCEPELMISIPRLAIISGLLIYPDGPLDLQKSPEEMCGLFSPFHGLLKKIRELLCILTEEELLALERALCSASQEGSSLHYSSTPHNRWKISCHRGTTPELKPTVLEVSENSKTKVRCSWESHATNIQCQNKTPGIINSNCDYGSCKSVPSFPERELEGHKLDVCENTEEAKSQHRNITYRNWKFQDLRSRYRSDSDMLHRLFVCIAGVADQLQTNFASDLRIILKTVFETMSSKQQVEREKTVDDALRLSDCYLCQNNMENNNQTKSVAPKWVPDRASSLCMSCCASFTLLRRRHHCRCCGKIFCSRCSAYTTSLPHVDSTQLVRVCSHCYHVHCVPVNYHRVR
ncbi:hypothetical protein GDO86_005568 [Hymenochirus boettgeri]|uniref:FYVE-type domain-containing protein n=1 Tax=Hymenochirus boettgeri TaxID=247094 RepID=A0A8T2J6K6_9PIPI|nr:hypothetical protein GDO86_005568 [Hymenochirus boettgeri]